MIITKAKFLTSQSSFAPVPGCENLPQIALVGKSNVGKSSLINSLCQRKAMAHTSSEPGKTRLINYYLLNDKLLLVDLPGYGFARAPKSEQQKWAAMIEGYLTGCSQLKFVFHLVDIRHEPTGEDAMMTEYLRHYNIPFSVISTKADKLSGAARGRMMPAICRKLVVQPWEIMQYSAETHYGREKLLDRLEEIIGEG